MFSVEVESVLYSNFTCLQMTQQSLMVYQETFYSIKTVFF